MALPWLAFGDNRGYFEPCGCDPEADLGGMVRLSALVQRERAITPDLSLFNLGNNLPTEKSEYYKAKHILSALGHVKPTASLFNLTEVDYFAGRKIPKGLRYVLSNVEKTMPGISKSIETSKMIVLGYVSPRSKKDNRRKLDSELLKRWQGQTRKFENRILLFAGSDDELNRVRAANFFTRIISSNAKPFSYVIGPEERDRPGQLDRFTDVRMVPVGGQGLLRGGELLSVKAPSLESLLGASECETTPSLLGEKPVCPARETRVTTISWLDRSLHFDVIPDIVRAYEDAGKERFAALSKARVDDLKSSVFLGSNACKTCHTSAYEKWEKSKHSVALQVLRDKDRSEDPECVGCHTLGFHEKGGFVSEVHSPQFANVQCENCHGPRKAHALNPLAKPKHDAKASCKTCHVGAHSPSFDYNEYWKLIAH